MNKDKYFYVYVVFGFDTIHAIDTIGLTPEILNSKFVHNYFCDYKKEAEDFCKGVEAAAYFSPNQIKTYIVDNSPKSAIETIEECIERTQKELDEDRIARLIENSYITV